MPLLYYAREKKPNPTLRMGTLANTNRRSVGGRKSRA